MDSGFERTLSIANNKHDIAALQVYDIREAEIPNVGMIKIKDAETSERIWIDTSDKRLRTAYKHQWNERQLQLQKIFKQSGVDSVSMSTSDDYVRAMMKLFKLRA